MYVRIYVYRSMDFIFFLFEEYLREKASLFVLKPCREIGEFKRPSASVVNILRDLHNSASHPTQPHSVFSILLLHN